MGGWPIRQREEGMSTWRDTESNHVLRYALLRRVYRRAFHVYPRTKPKTKSPSEKQREAECISIRVVNGTAWSEITYHRRSEAVDDTGRGAMVINRQRKTWRSAEQNRAHTSGEDRENREEENRLFWLAASYPRPDSKGTKHFRGQPPFFNLASRDIAVSSLPLSL